MSFFSKLWQNHAPRPMWAAHLSAKEFQSLKAHLLKYQNELKVNVYFDWDEGTYTLVGSEEHGSLFQLARNYERTDAMQRHNLARRFILMLASTKDTDKLHSQQLRECLRIRLYPRDHQTTGLVSKPIGNAFVAAVVVDRMTLVQSFQPGSGIQSGINDSTAFELALQNIIKFEPHERIRHELGFGLKVNFLEGSSPYTASNVIQLHKFLKKDEPHWVIVPSRKMLGFVPATNTNTKHMERLLRYSEKIYHLSDVPVTPHLLLWKQGQIIQASKDINGSRILLPEVLTNRRAA